MMQLIVTLMQWALLSALAACGARTRPPETPDKVVEMEALRIVAKHDDSGGYSFDSYDAEQLFRQANAELDAGRCPEAVALYDRIAQEFASSRYLSPSLYNAGLCLAQRGEREPALARFEALIQQLPDSPDVKHATLQAGHLQIDLARWQPAEQTAGALLARSDLDPSERLEAMAMQAEAQLGSDRLDLAEHTAKQALSFYRTRPNELFPDPYYAASVNFVIAEVTRLRGERMAFPDSTQDEQKAVLVRRAELLLDAQRAYFDTIRHTDAHWAAAAGHRIGGMYDKLWHDLVAAPVPHTISPEAQKVYPQEMAKLVKPLLRHAIRYWELTLLMVERTGVQTDWADQTRRDLERTRALLLEQPPGPGGLPDRPRKAPAPATEQPAEAPVSPQSQSKP